MEQKKISIPQNDKFETILYPKYCESTSPIGSVLIFHGMAEHHERYYEFADYLNSKRYDVYLYDHRGHGTNQKLEDLGFFADKDGWKRVLLDALEIISYLKKHNRCKKLFLFGHSMGSLILRNVIQYYDTVDGVIICGTTFPSPIKSFLGSFFAGMSRRFFGPKHRAKLIDSLLFGGKQYKQFYERTRFDWLSRNNPSNGIYIYDPYCGFLCTSSFYCDLIRLAANASKQSLIQKTRIDLPIFIISGTHDPVGNCGREVTSYFQLLQRLGFQNVECILYEECRHELLNELNRSQIMGDIATWLSKH